LFGYAGTGKTEIAREIGLNMQLTRFAAFTGKAAYVMRQRGCEPCSTIHKLIYDTHYDEVRQRYFRTLKEQLPATGLIIIDEASMLNERLAVDLLSFDIPVLVVGDPAQLPPVRGGGTGYFMRMHGEPDVMLTEVHRQALNNPILRLANDIRAGGRLPRVGYRAGDLRISQDAEREEFDTVLVGKNETRHLENRRLRVLNGFCTRFNVNKTAPQLGETVVCLRNCYSVLDPVWNGSTWIIDELHHDVIQDTAVDTDDGEPLELPIARLKIRDHYNGSSNVCVPLECFGAKKIPNYYGLGVQEFDYGYALTVHKAQGSEWANVLLVNEAPVFGDQAQRWLYTAVTRASHKLTILDFN
jgi:exodeoxyribonuclease-5